MTASSHPDRPTDENLPFPPRYWWLKRVLAVAGLLLVALIALRWWWGWEAERRFEAKIAEYRALGQPVTLEDFQFPPIPDEANAAYFLKQAASKITVPPGIQANFEDRWSDLHQIRANLDDLRSIVQANQEVLELADKARACLGADWKIRFVSPILNTTFPDLATQRRLAKLLGTTALYYHAASEDQSAIRTIRNADSQALRIVDRQGCLIQLLVQTAMLSITAHGIEQIAPNLKIARSDEESFHASPTQIRAAIDDLLAEDQLRADWRQAFFGERLFAVESARNPISNLALAVGTPTWTNWGGRVLKPMFQYDALFMMEYNSRIADAGAAFNYASAVSRAPAYPAFAGGIDRLSHFISRLCLPASERSIILHLRGIALRRMAAVALALRLYEVEHGARPATLDALVPDYLPAIPLDPFAPEGTPLKYLPNAPHPVLYSINADETDDGGLVVLRSTGEVDMGAGDLVFFLDGKRPHAPQPASTAQPNGLEAVIDECEEIGDGGEADHNQPASDEP